MVLAGTMAYEKAGFKMLPTGRKDKSTSAQILFYSIWAVLVSIIPFFGITGELKLSVVGVLAVFALGVNTENKYPTRGVPPSRVFVFWDQIPY